jgi:hypothetical protein
LDASKDLTRAAPRPPTLRCGALDFDRRGGAAGDRSLPVATETVFGVFEQTRATIVHYLGVMPALLLAQPPEPFDRAHRVRFGYGALLALAVQVGDVAEGAHAGFAIAFATPNPVALTAATLAALAALVVYEGVTCAPIEHTPRQAHRARDAS